MTELIDTHCHIHDSEYDFLIDEVLDQAKQAGVVAMICVGTDSRSNYEAQAFCQNRDNCYYSLALHPHEVAKTSLNDLKRQWQQLTVLAKQAAGQGKLVAIGECGLDYYYHQAQATLKKQRQLLSWHLQLADELALPVIFHVRRAFDDFWPVYDNQPAVAGVIHSFSDNQKRVNQTLKRPELYLGLNGIMTFSKDPQQLEAARKLPLEKLVLETDAPYLTPAPDRGKLNAPANLRLIADFLAELRQQPKELLAQATTANARKLFKL